MTLIVNATTTVTHNQFDPTNPAIQYGAPNVQVTIAAGISAISGGSYGVISGEDGSTLVNDGNIFGTVDGAFFLLADDARVVNNAGRSIAGRNEGVSVIGSHDATVINHGTVRGHEDSGILVSGPSHNFLLNNDGYVYGPAAGVNFANSNGGIQLIQNSGLIDSDQFGVFINTDPDETTVIINLAGGTIGGNVAAILTIVDGRFVLDNHGTIAGNILADATNGNINDMITNKGKITGNVFLGDGNDLFNGNGGKASKVFGEDGSDKLIGGKSGDALDGGAGLDTIRGGRGHDILSGGTERDLFDFNSIKDSVRGAKRDKLMDFSHAEHDRIDLKDIDAKAGIGGNQAFHFIGKQGFHDQKGELRYTDKGSTVIVQGDVNGDGHADFEIFVHASSLTKGDFVL